MNAQPKQKPQAEPQKSGSKRETEAFVATLRHLDRDGVLAEANAAVEAAVMAAKTTGGRAEVTVKLTFGLAWPFWARWRWQQAVAMAAGWGPGVEQRRRQRPIPSKPTG